MSQLRHPNIVQIFDFNVAPDARPTSSWSTCRGATWKRGSGRAAAAAGRHPHRRRDRIGLALAHAHGVVHRDLKPANIFSPPSTVRPTSWSRCSTSASPRSGRRPRISRTRSICSARLRTCRPNRRAGRRCRSTAAPIRSRWAAIAYGCSRVGAVPGRRHPAGAVPGRARGPAAAVAFPARGGTQRRCRPYSIVRSQAARAPLRRRGGAGPRLRHAAERTIGAERRMRTSRPPAPRGA